jgi:superfamily II DNA or RNA helicase
MFELRPYQVNIAQRSHKLLKDYGIVYLSVQVRCGKTLMSLHAADLYGANNVLFLTKKKIKTS